MKLSARLIAHARKLEEDKRVEEMMNEFQKAGRGGNIPTKEHQFKPGQSGNPKGRPKQLLTTYLREYLEADDGKLAKQVIARLITRATCGDTASVKEIFKRIDGPVADTENQKVEQNDRPEQANNGLLTGEKTGK